MISRTAVAIGLVALHAACSRSADREGAAAVDAGAGAAQAAHTSSCDRVTGMSVCSEVRVANDEKFRGAACARLGGTFVAAECPNTNVLGGCALPTGELRKFYASGGAAYDAPRAEKECTGPYKGTWTAVR